MSKFVYATKFNLTNPVNDFDAAADYLSRDDMTKYLVSSIEHDNPEEIDPKSIQSIEWVLETDQSGKIILITSEKLNDDQLDEISQWIKGQCSDGLGEGFEQQEFAEIYDEDEFGEPDPETYQMASFDWETNAYPLELVSVNEQAVVSILDHLMQLKEEDVKKTAVKLKSVLEQILDCDNAMEIRQVLENANPSESNPLKVDAPRGQYFIWQSGDEIYGSTEKPGRVVNARAIKNFTQSGFETVDDVVAYVKKYF